MQPLLNLVFQYTFGYATLIFPGFLAAYGIFLLLDQSREVLLKPFLVSIGWIMLTSMVLAMPESLQTIGNSSNYYPSGLIGGFASDLITRYMGKFALGFLLFIFLTILSVITFEFPIEKMPKMFADALGNWFSRLFDRLNTAKAALSNTFQSAGKVFTRAKKEVDETTSNLVDDHSVEVSPYAVEESTPIIARQPIFPEIKPAPIPGTNGNGANADSKSIEIPNVNVREISLNDDRDIPLVTTPKPVIEEAPLTATDIEFPLKGAGAVKDTSAGKQIIIDDLLEDPLSIPDDLDEKYDEMVRDAAAKYVMPSVELFK